MAHEAIDVDDTILDGRSDTGAERNSTDELCDNGKWSNLSHC